MNRHIPSDPLSPLLDVYLTEMHSYVREKRDLRMFIAALLSPIDNNIVL